MATPPLPTTQGIATPQTNVVPVRAGCVCDAWNNISSIIPASKYEGYQTDCHAAINKQLLVMGYKESGKRYQLVSGIYPKNKQEAYSLTYNKSEFIKAVEYLKKSIAAEIPVTVGIDDLDDRIKKARGQYVNPDGVTDHFIVIVGMGHDSKGNYFLFYDNADSNIGTSEENKLYCRCDISAIVGAADSRSRYSGSKTYVVTTVRESAKVAKNLIPRDPFASLR